MSVWSCRQYDRCSAFGQGIPTLYTVEGGSLQEIASRLFPCCGWSAYGMGPDEISLDAWPMPVYEPELMGRYQSPFEEYEDGRRYDWLLTVDMRLLSGEPSSLEGFVRSWDAPSRPRGQTTLEAFA